MHRGVTRLLAGWFSTMDLVSGCNQVPVLEKDRPKTTFCTPFGLFEFNRMPFGLCNAPSTFQRLMERMFGEQQGNSLLLYLDDIVVFSSSVSQHLERLEVVLGCLECEGLKAKLAKCAFFQKKVQYLGQVISAQGVSTDPGKIEAVSQWRRPTSASELCLFLGFASYYHCFVQGFAKLAAPLHQVVAECAAVRPRVQAGKSFLDAWSEQCQQSFEELKVRLTTAPVLAYADFSLPFILEVDASYGGLGAVLSQEQGGRVRPIAYASRSLRPTEHNMVNYSSMKLEQSVDSCPRLPWCYSVNGIGWWIGRVCCIVVFFAQTEVRRVSNWFFHLLCKVRWFGNAVIGQALQLMWLGGAVSARDARPPKTHSRWLRILWATCWQKGQMRSWPLTSPCLSPHVRE